MIEIIKENAKSFFITWAIVIFLNQLFIFGACFAPYCIIAALPHTGIIAAVVTYLKFRENSEEVKEKFKQARKILDELGRDEISKERKEADEEYRKVREEKENLKQAREILAEIDRDLTISLSREEIAEEQRKVREEKKEYIRRLKEEESKADPLKEMGDAYEKTIGKEFESRGELVIYNGLIKGFDDKGVDLIVISPIGQSINLIQCKNWQQRKMELQHITKVYNKLTNYEFDFHNLEHSTIEKHLCYKKKTDEIDRILHQSKNYTTIRKTLYIATDQVVDLNIGEHLTMVKPDIFRYKDMKIAIVKNN